MIPRCPSFLILTCVVGLSLMPRFALKAQTPKDLALGATPKDSVLAAPRQQSAVAQNASAQVTHAPRKNPFWASPWFLGSVGASGVVGALAVLTVTRKPRLAKPSDASELPITPFDLTEISADADRATQSPETTDGNSSASSSVNGNGRSKTASSLDLALPIPAELHKANRASATMISDSSVERKSLEPQNKTVEKPPVSETTRLAKINIVDELIQDLRSPDPEKRRKVIWDLGQRGDTRAVQPLVDLLIDSDSKQRSLVLSALSEIGSRTLKPMTRALAISLQDENAEVRKNAIRDLTRVYDMVAQISHLLHKASDDPDKDVQETARWALGQLNRIRSVSGDGVPALKNSVSPPENLRQ